VAPRGGNHVVLPLLGATSGVPQGQMVVCALQGAGVCRGTAGFCGGHGWFAPCSRCLGAPVAPKGHTHVGLPLLGATSGVHGGQVAVCGHWGAGGTEALLALVATKAGVAKAAGAGGLQ